MCGCVPTPAGRRPRPVEAPATGIRTPRAVGGMQPAVPRPVRAAVVARRSAPLSCGGSPDEVGGRSKAKAWLAVTHSHRTHTVRADICSPHLPLPPVRRLTDVQKGATDYAAVTHHFCAQPTEFSTDQSARSDPQSPGGDLHGRSECAPRERPPCPPGAPARAPARPTGQRTPPRPRRTRVHAAGRATTTTRASRTGRPDRGTPSPHAAGVLPPRRQAAAPAPPWRAAGRCRWSRWKTANQRQRLSECA